MRTDGIATFQVPAAAGAELGARAARELGPAVDALVPEDRQRLERLARHFRLPSQLDPLDGSEVEVHAGRLVFPGWRDYALLSRERGRVWFFRAVATP